MIRDQGNNYQKDEFTPFNFSELISSTRSRWTVTSHKLHDLSGCLLETHNNFAS